MHIVPIESGVAWHLCSTSGAGSKCEDIHQLSNALVFIPFVFHGDSAVSCSDNPGLATVNRIFPHSSSLAESGSRGRSLVQRGWNTRILLPADSTIIRFQVSDFSKRDNLSSVPGLV